MDIKWHRIAGCTLIGLAIYLFYKLSPLLEILFEKANSDYGHENFKAFMLLVMCALLIAGVVLIFLKK